jgi:hypothetical protein
MTKRFLQEISLSDKVGSASGGKESPVGFKKRMEGYPGIPPNRGLPGKRINFFPARSPLNLRAALLNSLLRTLLRASKRCLIT